MQQGIEQPLAKKIVAAIKAAKLKVEAQINGDKLRVSAKKRDDLQAAMALLRKSEFEQPPAVRQLPRPGFPGEPAIQAAMRDPLTTTRSRPSCFAR